MHWKKFMRQANENNQQYSEGLITKAELLAKTQGDLNQMIERELTEAESTLKVFGFETKKISGR